MEIVMAKNRKGGRGTTIGLTEFHETDPSPETLKQEHAKQEEIFRRPKEAETELAREADKRSKIAEENTATHIALQQSNATLWKSFVSKQPATQTVEQPAMQPQRAVTPAPAAPLPIKRTLQKTHEQMATETTERLRKFEEKRKAEEAQASSNTASFMPAPKAQQPAQTWGEYAASFLPWRK